MADPFAGVADRRVGQAAFMVSSLWEINLTKFGFILIHLLKTQNKLERFSLEPEIPNKI